MQVKQLFFSTSFLVTHPFVGHLVCLRRVENVLSGNASPHSEAKVQVKQLVCLNKYSGDPPLRGSPGVLAPHGQRIEWQCIASC